MSENFHIVNYALGLAPSIAYSITYALGGRDKAPWVRPRIWKRFIAPVLFCSLLILLSILTHNFKWGYLTCFPTYILAHFLIGYGGEKLWVKVLRRVLSGLVIGVASSSIAVFAKSYVFLVMQVCLAISAHLALGLTNPTEAPKEEGLISLLTVIFVPFMVM